LADPVFPWTEQGEIMRERLPRGGEAEPIIVEEARHFIQEWVPRDCAEALSAVAREAFKGA
jgi:pimeloyl-ACP methyl ester carboxylesterase